jgi:uncharacterized protein YpmS
VNPGFLIILALLFAGLFALRVAILLILRRPDKAPRKDSRNRWPNATVIQTRDKP